MTLREKQTVFAELLRTLITEVEDRGYEPTLSALRRGLSLQLNLYKAGRLVATRAAHAPIGDFWQRLSTPEYECVWRDQRYGIRHGGRT